MPLQRVAFDERPTIPWRNGGGVTRELLAWPCADDWALRISVADIARDGPFSAFAGVERWFAVLTGEGVRLGAPAVGAPAVGVTVDDDALRFDGGDAPSCALQGGPTRDLNLMLRADRVRGEMVRVDGEFQWADGPAVLRAVFTRDGCTLTVGDDAVAVSPMTLAWTDARDDASVWRLIGVPRRASTWAITVRGA